MGPEPSLKPGWKQPLPQRMARPTYWPAMLALGINLALLGFITNFGFTAVGAVFIAVSLAGWIGEILHG